MVNHTYDNQIRNQAQEQPNSKQTIESPGERFRRLAAIRVNQAIPHIRRIANLTGAEYAYDEQDLAKIEQALKHEIDVAIQALLDGTGAVKPFSF